MLHSDLFINEHLKAFYQHLETCLKVRFNLEATTTLEGLEALFEQTYYTNSYEIYPGSSINLSRIEKIRYVDLYEKGAVIKVQPIPSKILERCLDTESN